MQSTGIIILAAGASKRLGTPKQQLVFEDKKLLQRITDTALQTTCTPVIVVLGAYAAGIREDITTTAAHTVVNTRWPEGMGGSIRTGMDALLRISHDVSSTFLLLCDQPYITTPLLQEMMQLQTTTGKNIIASAYNDIAGTPVLFHQSFFPQLLSLTGQEGARKILRAHPQDIATVDFPQGAIDIDTPDDYHNMK
ncbi:nucleotidyltransferase family protein [Chitinophaga sp. Mgbs1]|uniref:Nucleotidyltransferase family protein n=1 Tax=Chitinophaga solisilvae TaxID=1233460 RepID=A0A3S1AZY1_9BACT|nr:nucleotidyltransferase family protein [Chitinophaga solisilvae]